MPHNLPLRSYQQQAVDFALKTGSCLLAEDVGLGKSLEAIAIASARESNSILVICPSSLKYGWKAEIEKWTLSKNISVIDGSREKRAEQWKFAELPTQPLWVICNYELLLKDIEPYAITWDLVIFDEATRLVNPKARTSKLVKKIPSTMKLLMTGTPITNRPENIWNLIDTIRPGYLGSHWNFINRYCVKDYWGSIKSYVNLDELAKRIAPLYIRRTKEQVLTELPPIVSTDIVVELSAPERKLYNAVKKEILYELTNDMTSKISLASLGSALVRMTRLKQIADGMELIGEHKESAKIEALHELLEQIGNNKVIVFSQFAEMCKLLYSELQSYYPLLITGSVSSEDRQQIIDDFNNPRCHNKILIMSEAGSEGLNIQHDCSYIVHFDLAWSLSKMVQRTGRVHRMGQKNTVFEYSLIAKETVDEYIRKTIMKKRTLSDQVISATDEVVSVHDIEEMLT